MMTCDASAMSGPASYRVQVSYGNVTQALPRIEGRSAGPRIASRMLVVSGFCQVRSLWLRAGIGRDRTNGQSKRCYPCCGGALANATAGRGLHLAAGRAHAAQSLAHRLAGAARETLRRTIA